MSYFDIPGVDYEQPPLFTWKEFYNFRNHVLQVLRDFGSAGPLGEADLSVDWDQGPSFSDAVVENPDFFIVDDMYNEHDRLSVVECQPKYIGSALIESLSIMARDFPGWRISFSLGDSGMQVSSDAIFVDGRRFWDCTSVEEIADRCSKPVDFGTREPISEEMYRLWVATICGEVRSTTVFPDPQDREWTEVIRSLKHTLEKKDGHLGRFAYDLIRNDIHPETRRQFLLRFLANISSLAPEILRDALHNVQKDAALALVHAENHDDRIAIVQSLGLSQRAIADKLEAREMMNWWANVIHYVEEPAADVKGALIDELRDRVSNSHPVIQLSAIFGLSRLHFTDIAFFVDEGMKANKQWLANDGLTKWLMKLRSGSTSWPDSSIFL